MSDWHDGCPECGSLLTDAMRIEGEGVHHLCLECNTRGYPDQ